VEPIEWCAEKAGANPDCGHAQCDDALQARMIEHTVSQATGHYFHATLGLFDVDADEWGKLSIRKEILKNLRPPGEATPYGADMFDLRSNFTQDASMCWKQHGRTKNCGDWKAASKRLVPPTKELRKELGLETRDKHRPTAAFLCDYCPVRSIMQSRANADAGHYDRPE
jgi:hypothetical protein